MRIRRLVTLLLLAVCAVGLVSCGSGGSSDGGGGGGNSSNWGSMVWGTGQWSN